MPPFPSEARYLPTHSRMERPSRATPVSLENRTERIDENVLAHPRALPWELASCCRIPLRLETEAGRSSLHVGHDERSRAGAIARPPGAAEEEGLAEERRTAAPIPPPEDIDPQQCPR